MLVDGWVLFQLGVYGVLACVRFTVQVRQAPIGFIVSIVNLDRSKVPVYGFITLLQFLVANRNVPIGRVCCRVHLLTFSIPDYGLRGLLFISVAHADLVMHFGVERVFVGYLF